MSDVTLRDVRKSFGAVEIIKGVDLDIKSGEFVVFVGPSGCGKSTLLRMIAGLETITSGELDIGGERMNEVDPSQRGIAMVFQSYALYPHMTVRENMGFALKYAGMPKAEIRKQVDEAARILELEPLMDRKPKALSGGQRQRVAIGRAIVRHPKVFLFDEPLSNLDAELRVHMRIEIAKLHRDLGATIVYVTHDQVEAMTLADKIVVLRLGIVEQVGAPLELFDNPANLFVAGFIGSPQMNFITGNLAQRAGAETIGVRPEHLVVNRDGDGWRGRVVSAEHLGSDTFIHVEMADASRLTARTVGDMPVAAGDDVTLMPIVGHLHRFGADGKAL